MNGEQRAGKSGSGWGRAMADGCGEAWRFWPVAGAADRGPDLTAAKSSGQWAEQEKEAEKHVRRKTSPSALL